MNPYSKEWVPVGKRKTIVIGGFEVDTPRDKVELGLNTMMAGTEGIDEMYAGGKYTSVGKVRFHSSDLMWNFLKAWKGRKLQYQGKRMWHQIERNEDERDLSKKCSTAASLIRQELETAGMSEEDARARFDGDWSRGYLMFKRDDGRHVRLYERVVGTLDLKVAMSSRDSGLQFDFAGHLAEINRAA